jgi:hypothetical protein
MARSPALVRTKFGPGKLARTLYFVASMIVVVPLLVESRHGLPPGVSTLEFIAFMGAVGVLAGALTYGASRLSAAFRRRQQKKRDRRAAAIMEDARAGRPPDFSLYLRAFETTGGMHEIKDIGTALGAYEDTDFESELAEAVENNIPLVGLGKPGEQEGAGRWPTSDATWQADVEVLARAALLLFLLPSARAGTLWELDWIIANRLLGKTVFVQPPYDAKRRRGKEPKPLYDWEAAWKEVRAAGLTRSLKFPEFRRRGAFFTFAADGAVAVYTEMRGVAGWILARRVNRHLKAMARLRAPHAVAAA